jgi:threonine aldolase
MTPVSFRSDNVAGVAPEILAAIGAANGGTAPSYGTDPLTAQLQERFGQLFETKVRVAPVATGTAANALSLSLLAGPYGAVMCSATAHINDSECGAGEFFTGGAKLVTLASRHGKLQPDALEHALATAGIGMTHRVQPQLLSVTEGTERGTLYQLDELRELFAIAKRFGLRIHMDGARFANALAALRCSPAELTWKLGVDVLSFGATKNGAMCTDAVVVFDPGLFDELGFRARRAGQVFSKMRFLSAQLLAYVEGGLWLRLADNANATAARLARGLEALSGVTLVDPVEINEVFATMPPGMIEGLKAAGMGFHDRGGGHIRAVTAFDTTEEQVDAFLAAAARHAD